MQSRYAILALHLRELMGAFGVTCEQLGKAIGVTKQTISNLARRNVRMTKEHYLAIRLYFDYLVDFFPETKHDQKKMLAYVTAFGTKTLEDELGYIFRLGICPIESKGENNEET